MRLSRPHRFAVTTGLRGGGARMMVVGLDAESVGPGIYGGCVLLDESGAMVIGQQYEQHNPLPGPVYAGGGYTELSAAIRTGEPERVRALLSQRPELCDEVSTGFATPLHVCGMSRAGERCAVVLCEARGAVGLSVDALDGWGYTALQRCATNDLALGARALLEAGADHRRPSGTEQRGDSARQLALRFRHFATLKAFQQWELERGEELPEGEPRL